MIPKRSCSVRFSLRANALFCLWAIGLILGCSILPIDELHMGPVMPLRFSERHHPYWNGEIIFSHIPHEGMGCDTCHEDSRKVEEVRSGDLPPMVKCLDCHDGRTLSNDCQTCHVNNRRERKPRFHTGLWTANHKEMAYEESYKCSLCHVNSECQGCHSVRKPTSHTLRFGASTHGRLAIQDRRSCATCHETDFCVDCHNQPPPDHTLTFMGPRGHQQVARLKLRTCLTCHRFEDDCSAAGCHTSP